jgi:uncharacterized protein (DUF1499 family)
MKIAGFITVTVSLLLIALLVAGQMGLLQGTAPLDLGVKNGLMKPPSATPNSVSSQSDLYPTHPQAHYARIEPIQFQGDGDLAMTKIAALVRATDRTVLVKQEADYIYAQSSTPLLKFTDDLEFWLDRPNAVIHVRSASRLGRKDFNVNRERVEKIRAQFSRN